MEVQKLIDNIKAEHSRVLMGIKPGFQARTVWNRALQAIVDSVPEEFKPAVKAYFMEVRL